MLLKFIYWSFDKLYTTFCSIVAGVDGKKYGNLLTKRNISSKWQYIILIWIGFRN